MKHLFTGLALISLLVIVWGGYHLYLPAPAFGSPGVTPAPLPDTQPVTPEQLAQLERLEDDLRRLQWLLDGHEADNTQTGSWIATSPTRATGEKPRPKEKNGRTLPPLPHRHVSLVLIGQDRRAVVDGLVVAEGSSLPGNGRVVSIRPDAVVVQESHGRQQTLILQRPEGFGTLHPALAKDTTGATR